MTSPSPPSPASSSPTEPVSGDASAGSGAEHATGSIQRALSGGVAWTVACGAVTKVVSTLAQIGLAWFLFPGDYALVAMTTFVGNVAAFFSSTSLKNWLVARQDRFDELAPQVLWVAIVLHAIMAGAIAIGAPLIAHRLGGDGLEGLLRCIGLAVFFGALPTVHLARLSIDLRFAVVAKIQMGEGIIKAAGSIGLAALGWGPYSIIVTELIVRIYAAVLGILAAGPMPRARPRPASWPRILASSFGIMVYSFLEANRAHAANFIITVLARRSIAGLYLWGFQVAGQAIVLLTMNMVQVFFPALAKLNDRPSDQTEVFVRAARGLTLVVGLVAVLQAALADAGIRWLFEERWFASAEVVRCMSIAMVFLPLGVVGTSVLLARGAFRRLAVVNAAQTGVVALAAAITAPSEDLTRIAVGVSIGQTLAYCLPALWVIVGSPASARALFGSLVRPWLVTVLTGIVGALFRWQTGGWRPAVTVAVGIPIIIVAWGILLALVWPDAISHTRRVVAGRLARRPRLTLGGARRRATEGVVR